MKTHSGQSLHTYTYTWWYLPDSGLLKTHSTCLLPRLHKNQDSGQICIYVYLPSGVTQTVDKDPDGGQLKDPQYLLGNISPVLT